MTYLEELREIVLADRKISANEVTLIEKFLVANKKLDLTDIKFLVELMKAADEICPEFDEILFPCVRSVILEDGEISREESVLLMEMLCSGDSIRQSERNLIDGLFQQTRAVAPEFSRLYEAVFG
ncbi:hypothetical protein [Roseiconus lacunae]|uniref:Co-chaperone DjlA N-terminal domain-containing protein n=1 Tax=Roseiconus lacunae TaxID=2605694 RepID=A0ABT7PGK7_9BACT|nr:hypothetical protein [Roseiconus lacunae]MCD0461937.1 hypothetical protein [Roseiconus lacunae]MDM4015606.1 hypothetical protein [Roseiconus lacunae]WRQ52705.1 hypothetical protein U8335_09180 [Stieleria sp. HD01]